MLQSANDFLYLRLPFWLYPVFVPLSIFNRMAYNEFLADRVRFVMNGLNQPFFEKKMMGGLVFMVDNKMCLGIIKEDLMARIDPDREPEALAKVGCREMDFTHQKMKGYVFVNPEGTDLDKDLEYWAKLALEFNPKAKASKK
jgi:hypothetical protein